MRARVDNSPFSPEAVPARGTITARQAAFIASLFAGRDLAAETRPAWRTRLLVLAGDSDEVAALDKTAASALIDALTALPRKAADHAEDSGTVASLRPGVPAGHYALTVDGRTRFYRVDRPTEGTWAGAVFIREQAGDEFYPMRGQRRDVAMDAIAADPAKASRAYGLSIGRCGLCNRTLTDASSRARGLGPTCGARVGW